MTLTMSSAPDVHTELLEQFQKTARDAAATIEVIERSPDALCIALQRATEGLDKILYADPQDLPADLFARFLADPRVITNPTQEELKTSEAGVTEAFCGIARTGSVGIDVGYQLTGFVSLLAPLHVAVLGAQNIVSQPRDVLRRDQLGGKGLTRDFVLVTGPSATADMGPLVRGVHGPHRLHIIVLK
jgi:L-lactate dehydrogenase complex protein LldG